MKHDVSVHWNTPAIQARREQLYFGETFPCSSHCITNHHPNHLGHIAFEEQANDTFVWPQRYNIEKSCNLLASVPSKLLIRHPAYCLFSSMWWGNHFYSPNKRNIEFPMHSNSFVNGTKMAVVTSGENQELGYLLWCIRLFHSYLYTI